MTDNREKNLDRIFTPEEVRELARLISAVHASDPLGIGSAVIDWLKPYERTLAVHGWTVNDMAVMLATAGVLSITAVAKRGIV
jgi:hypothetical protein